MLAAMHSQGYQLHMHVGARVDDDTRYRPRCLVVRAHSTSTNSPTCSPAMLLCARYAMSGTCGCYATTRSLSVPACTTYAVLTSAKLLPGSAARPY
eukprot:3940454-Rhodomonas_salina.2